jgi:hypothetical protein
MMRLIGCAILFALLLGLFIFHYPGHGVSAQAKNVAAPAFTLNLLTGGVLNSSELKGNVTVLKFVASY